MSGTSRPGPGFFLEDALSAIRTRVPHGPELHLVLGSGLGTLAEGLEGAVEIPFQEVPGLPPAGVDGHSGKFVLAEMEGKGVLLQAGRFHFYEGHRQGVVVAPIRLGAALGVNTLILTNAAGGISRNLSPGSILLLDDHIDVMGRSPLAGPVQGEESRFPDMSRPYDPELMRTALRVARELEIPLERGTYAAVLGPSYETPAEIRFLAGAGAHAVGMSTVPEVIAAGALGIRALAFSLITNRAAGMGKGSLSHQEVVKVGREAGGRLEALIRGVVRALP